MEATLKRTEEEQANKALIAEMLRDATKVELPSELTRQPIVHSGDAVLPAPMTVKEISSAGYVWVWDTRSYEKVPILYYMLPSRLRERRPDGSFRFTTTDPGKEPKRGTIKCLLHPEAANRAHYDELGFRVCNKNNITNPYQLQQHMKKKHPQEWAAIEEERKTAEREQDRALQHALLTQQLEKRREIAQEVEQESQKSSKASFICDICGADFGAQITLKRHKETHK